MSKAALLGVLVLGAGVVGYHTLVKPQVADTVAQLGPMADSTMAAAQTLKDQSLEAVDALKATSVGRKINDMWNDRTPFFDPMPTPPSKP